MPILYCPLCGILLLSDPINEEDPGPPLSRRRPWFAEVRGLVLQHGKKPQDADAVLTGIGIIRDDNVLLAPTDSDVSYPGHENLDKWVLCESFEQNGGFGFHAACWKLLVLRLGPMYEEFKTDLLTAMFSLLWSTPCVGSSSFDFGHDYNGAEILRGIRVRPWTTTVGAHLYAHPFHILQLDDVDAPVTPDTAEDTQKTEWGPRLFGLLPPELKDAAFSYLTYDEVEIMRLVSRDMAHLAADHKLPQEYWKSRFMLGQEMDFIFPDLKEKRNWCKIFFAVKACLDRKDGPMVNRRRIRNLIEPIAALLEDRTAMGLPMPDGLPLVPVYWQNGVRCMKSQGGEEYAYVNVDEQDLFSSNISPFDPYRVLQLGCRRLNWVMYPLERLDQTHYNAIVVSTIRLGSRCFISGICMLSDPSDTAQAPWVGYPECTKKVWIRIPPATRPESISVAFCSQGLRGIRFNFTNSESSVWVGDSSGMGVACGLLFVPESKPWALVVGADHFKLVSLGIGVLSKSSPTPPEQPRQTLPTALSHLWINGIPRHHGLILGDPRPPIAACPFEPLINLDFGGPKGLRLSALTGFVFYMGKDDNPILGIEAIYADGNTVFVGRRGGCELSFPIDGLEGERVNRVGVFDNSRLSGDTPSTEDRYFGIQLATNYGRTATFATIKSRLARTVLYSSNRYPQYAITGFAIGYVPHKNQLGRLALQYQTSEPPGITPPVSFKMSHEALYRNLEYDSRFSMFTDYPGASSYQTHATLAGVRRVQASVGVEGRSRTPNSICGLKFEYDDGSVSIIGQWMDPYQALKLGPNAQIQSLTVWVSRPQKGQISAIRIGTSDARSITFTPHGVRSHPGGDLRHEYGTGPGEQVTDIFWILNDSFDRVRGVVDRKDQRPSTLLPNQYPPFDAVQRLYFQQIAGDGSRDPVVAAKGYFLETALVGLKFVYASGSKAQIGDTTDAPDHRVKVRFVKQGRVVGMLVGIRDNHIRYLKFHLDYYRKPLSKNPVKQFSYNLDLVSPLEDIHTATYKCQSAWCRDAEAAAKFPRAQANHNVYGPPSSGGSLAGLYVRCQQFSCLGALYE